MSVVMTTEDIYAAFYDRYETLKGFLHSHSYTGNALAARAALASLEIFRTDNVLANNRQLAAVLADALAPLAAHPHVLEVRQTGLIAAVELVQDRPSRTPFDWRERRGLRIFEHALQKGVLLRPIGNVVYFLPPYVITPDEIHFMVAVAAEAIDIATRGAPRGGPASDAVALP
ncbi:MAG: adenosylmethionine-8-amino-7-oxononanoate aminotransferase [Moraxellaceae bacterium]|nr:adenosylmethionine-8-amino-7-oxononanoate aminotransferase [Moraxellaceae bacterium]